MSLKMKLVSMISAFVLVIGMLLIGVFAVNQAQVDMGGSITFNADDVYARVTGSVEKAQVAPAGLDVTYSATGTTGNPTAWESLDLEFDSYATPIVISITVENLSTERSLTVNLTDALTSSVPNLGKALQRDNDTYTSGTNITLDPKDNGTSTTTFTITLSVTDKNQSLTNAQFDYDLNLYDESYKFPEVYDYFTFSDNGDGTVTLTDFNESLADGKIDIVIPATVSQNADEQWIDGDDYIVTAIAEGDWNSGVFYNSGITSIELPSTLESIGDYAFQYCRGLTSVDLSGCTSLTSIAGYAFQDCSGLTSITLPEGLRSIGEAAFSYCSGLTSVDLSGCTSLTSTGNFAFFGCSGLTSITLPSSLTSIGDDAFEDCTSLESIALPEGLTSIGDKAFYGCSNLQPSITDQGVKYLGNKQNQYLVLWDGTDITTLTYTVNENCKFIHSYAFSSCSNLTSITLPEGLTSIGGYAFDNCDSLRSITLPEGLTSIGRFAFYNCRSLTSITLPEGLTSIGGGAFQSCSSLTSIILPSSLTSIGRDAFYGCSGLKEVIINSGYVYTNATSKTACGDLLYYATTVKVLSSLVSGSHAYINTTKFPNVDTEEIEGKSYTVYSKN